METKDKTETTKETAKEILSTKGRAGRAAGKRFEILVRKDLEKKGFVVAKWTNQVDLLNNKLVPAKSKFNPFLKRVMSGGTGLPDFIIFRGGVETSVDGVEAKMRKYLDAEEKKKMRWLLDHHIFSKILIAFKSKIRGKIQYENFS